MNSAYLHATQLLLRGHRPGTMGVYDTSGREVALDSIYAVQFTLVGAIARSAMRIYKYTPIQAMDWMVATLSINDPRYTKYLAHPVILGVPENKVLHRVMAFGIRATKLQCIEFASDVGREIAA